MMPTLKDMWDYPNNSANGYMADSADWSGDESFGMDKRVGELRDGTYRAWPGLDPVADLSKSTVDVNTAIAKYTDYLDSYGDDTNLTFNMLHKYPIIEHSKTAYSYITGNVTKIESFATTDGDGTYAFHTGNPIGIEDGARITIQNMNTSGTLLDSTVNGLLSVYGATDIGNFGGFCLVDGPDNDFDGFADDTQANGIFGATPSDFNVIKRTQPYDGYFLKTGSGVKYVAEEDDLLAGVANGDNFRLKSQILGTSILSDSVYNTGTIDQRDTDFYVTYAANDIGGALNSMDFFTDVGRTTNATTDEFYYATVVYSVTNSGGSPATFALTDLDFQTPSGLTISAGTGRNTNVDTFSELNFNTSAWSSSGVGKMPCRIYYQNLSGGTITTTQGQTLGTSIDYDQVFFVMNESPNLHSFSSDWGDTDNSNDTEFELSAGASVEIVIKFIDPAQEDGGHVLVEHIEATPSACDYIENRKIGNYYISSGTIQLPGNQVYSWKDVSNVTQYQAYFDYSNGYYSAGQPINNYTGLNELAPAVSAGAVNPTVDGSGYISGISAYQTANTNVNGGIFTSSDPVLFPVIARSSEYVAPTTYAEDVWDTDDEWDQDGFASGAKNWPTNVRPSAVKITTSQPASITRSQNGTKYVRSSGVIRQQLEVQYPPMDFDAFREFEAVVEAARGQATPFYFNVKFLTNPALYDSATRDILLQRLDTANALLTTSTVRVKDAVSVGDKTVLVEGFAQDESDAFIRGEYLIAAQLGYSNGNFAQVINDNVDSNSYGEAKIRFPYGARSSITTGEAFYKNPSHIVVTLAQDDFEYSVGTDGLYRFTCIFDFDEYK